jgi:hypothetical protein
MSGAPAAGSDEELRELLELIRGADSVELKLTVPDAERAATVEALGLDPLDAHLRQVFFFDTPDLDLNEAGVVVRARRTQGRDDDSVVKLRPAVPDELPAAVRSAAEFGVEVDAMPGGFVCSGSYKGATKRVRQAVSGERPISKLFSAGQRAFYDAHAPEGIGLDDLTVLGPVHVLKLKQFLEDLGRKLAVELWFYPDGSRIFELSTKCEPGEAFQVAAEARAALSERGVDLAGRQETKTRAALDFFAGRAKG